MVEWQPIAEEALRERIAQGVARMSGAERRLWETLRVEPQKWAQSPYGDDGGGFWVVGLIGQTVLWYNDREDGFNRSTWSAHGVIDDYWCNDDELEVALRWVISAIEHGTDLLRMPRPAVPRSR